MTSDAVIFAGIDISSGRQPVTFAALDEVLNIVILADWTIPEAVACVQEHRIPLIVIDAPASKTGQGFVSSFRKKMLPDIGRQWLETNAQACYQAFQANLFPLRTLEGRIQRALILYEEGLQIKDPMDFYEEITRHKLLMGEIPREQIYSMKQLDALISAYVAWLVFKRPQLVVIQNDSVLPSITQEQ